MDELQTMSLAYQPSAEAKKILKQTQVLLLVGPTGSGKNTLEQQLIKTGKYKPIVTHTTRKPRLNGGVLEEEGIDYHFISDTQAKDLFKDHKFIETAFTHGHFYGTTVHEFKLAKKDGKIPMADIDIKGVRSYRQLSDKVTAVFLLPPSFSVLISRLIARYGTEHKQADINVRLGTALDELYELINTEYYYTFINKQIDTTTKKVLQAVAGELELKVNKAELKLARKLIDDIKAYLQNEQF